MGNHVTNIQPVTEVLEPSQQVEQPSPAQQDYQSLYEESKAENQRLSAILEATKTGPATSPNQATKPAISAARVKAVVGQVGLLKMSRDEKLKALGVDPASITDDGLKKLFGRGNDGSLGADLMKVNPGRYRSLREAALLLNLYGA